MTRNFLKFVRYSVLVLIVLLFLSFFATQLDSVKHYLLSFVIESFEAGTGYQLAVKEVEFLLPFEVKARGVTVSKEETVLATCENMVVRVHPSFLFDRQVDVSLVTLNDVYLHTLPERRIGVMPSIAASEWVVNVRHYVVKNVRIDACISERLCVKPLNAEGHLRWDPAVADGDASIIASVVSDSSISPTAFGCYLQLDHDKVTVELSLDEQETGGIFFPDGIGVHGAIELTSTVDNWCALLTHQPMVSDIEGPVAVKIGVVGEKEIEGMVKGRIAIVEGPAVHLRRFEGQVGKTTISGTLHLNSDFSLGNSTVAVESADLSEFAHLFPEIALEGKASFTTTFQGTLTHPTIEMQMSTAGMAINHYPLPSANFHALAAWQQDRLVGKVEWSFDRDAGIEENSHATFQWVYGQHFILEEMRVALPGIAISGNIGASLPSWAATGALQGEFKDLSLLGRLLRMPISGNGQFDATFNSDEAEKQKVSIDLRAEDLVLAGMQAQEAQLTATLTTILDMPTWRFRLATSGRHHRLDLEGTWAFDDRSMIIEPLHANGIYYNRAVTLEHPFKILYGNDGVKVSPLTVSIDKGQLFAEVEATRGQVWSTVRGTALPLDLFDPGFYEQPLKGAISFDCTLAGEPQLLEGELTATLDNLVIPAETLSKLPPLHTTLTATLTKEELTLKGNTTGTSKTPLEFSATLPVHLMLTAPMVVVEKTRPMVAEIRSSGPIAPLLELMITDTTTITGDCSVDLRITGTPAAPIVQGEALLHDASFESPALGTQFYHISAKVSCEGDLVKLDHFSADDGKEGTITAKGRLLLEEKYPYNFDATVNNTLLLNLDTMKSTVSGTLSLSGDRTSAALKGQILSNKSLFSLPKKSSTLSDHIEVTYINQTAEELPPTLIKYKPLIQIPMTFDVAIGIPNTLAIDDENLSSSWKGELKLAGEAAAPLVTGEIKLTDGEYLLNGKEFDLAQGTIHFAGDPVKKTTLHVVAAREINDIRVEIVLKGKITDPDIALRSTPSLSQQEILSLILFGKSPAEITPHQDEQLEQSLSNLKMDEYEPGFFGRIQKTLGVDRIDINRDSNSANDDVSIHVGKYITKDIYISVEKGLGDEPNSIGVEAKVMENVKMTVEGSDDVSGQVSLKWRHDY